MVIFEDIDFQIRRYLPADLEQLPLLLSDPVTMQFWPNPYTPEQIKGWQERMIDAYQQRQIGRWAVVRKSDNQLIADAGIAQSTVQQKEVYDLGYILDHRFWRMGLGTRIARACLQHGFEVARLDCIVAHMAADHIGSQRVAEKLGMKRKADFTYIPNRNFLHHFYTLTATEYCKMKQNATPQTSSE